MAEQIHGRRAASASAPRSLSLTLAHSEPSVRAEARLTLAALGAPSSELEERDESGRVRLATRAALQLLRR